MKKASLILVLWLLAIIYAKAANPLFFELLPRDQPKAKDSISKDASGYLEGYLVASPIRLTKSQAEVLCNNQGSNDNCKIFFTNGKFKINGARYSYFYYLENNPFNNSPGQCLRVVELALKPQTYRLAITKAVTPKP